jgi:hypothetical protein
LSQNFWRPTPPRGFDQIPGSLGSDASVPICEFTDLGRIIRQIGQLVQDDVRFEVTNRLDKCLPVEDITKNRFGTKMAQELRFAGRARQAADYVPGLNQQGNQPLPNHAGGAGKKYSHAIIVGLASGRWQAARLSSC